VRPDVVKKRSKIEQQNVVDKVKKKLRVFTRKVRITKYLK
jgi:hypothetical protein